MIVGGHTRCCYRRLDVRHLHPTCVQAPKPNPNPKQGQTSVMVYMFLYVLGERSRCSEGAWITRGGGQNVSHVTVLFRLSPVTDFWHQPEQNTASFADSSSVHFPLMRTLMSGTFKTFSCKKHRLSLEIDSHLSGGRLSESHDVEGVTEKEWEKIIIVCRSIRNAFAYHAGHA